MKRHKHKWKQTVKEMVDVEIKGKVRPKIISVNLVCVVCGLKVVRYIE